MAGIMRALELRRLALCVLITFWLAGYWFFREGHGHLKVFWWFVLPAAILNADAWPPLRRSAPGLVILLALLLWQIITTSLGTGRPDLAGGLADAWSVVVLVLALVVLANRPHGWRALRLALVAVATATSTASLIVFYPLAGRSLADGRLRDVLVYDDGLNPVLTGLLAGFGMVAGISLERGGGTRTGRIALRVCIAALGFAMMATQSRGALIAAGAGTVVLWWRRRGELLPAIAAALAGIITCLTIFAVNDGTPDLVSRMDSGRIRIWLTYLGDLHGAAWLLGKGCAAPLDESVLGWHVHHPHSSFVTQIVHCGIPGLLLLGLFLGTAVRAAARNHGDGGAAFALLVFGLTSLSFDGAQIVSLLSVPRIEPLLVLVPAVFALNPPVHPAAPAAGP